MVHEAARATAGRRPLFVLLDATWSEARKMFRKSPYLDRFPVLSLRPEQVSRYVLRRSRRDDHFCTSEVAALCLELAGDARASALLEADAGRLHAPLRAGAPPVAAGSRRARRAPGCALRRALRWRALDAARQYAPM